MNARVMTALMKSVLVVEDAEDDVFFIRRLLSKAGVFNEIVHHVSVRGAKAYLDEICPTPSEPGACAVLCDIKLPGQSGFEFLEWVRAKQQPARRDDVALSLGGRPRARNTTRCQRIFGKVSRAQCSEVGAHEGGRRTHADESRRWRTLENRV